MPRSRSASSRHSPVRSPGPSSPKHSESGRPRAQRTASLGVREDIDYSDPTADRRERILGGVTVTLTVLAFAQQNWSAASLFLVVVGASLLRRWAQHRVVMRGRPAMESDLTEADDQVRRMAVRHGLARPMVTLMALLVSSQAAILGSAYEDPSLPRQAAGLISLALAIAGVVWWWTNRNFGAPSVNRASRPGGGSILRWRRSVFSHSCSRPGHCCDLAD